MIIYRKASRLLEIKVNEELHRYGLTPTQYNILDVLYRVEGITINDLKSQIFATSGNLTVILKNLEKKGYITRRPDSMDKRKSMLSITKQGIDKLEQVMPEYERFVSQLFQQLTQEENEQLIHIMKKFSAILED